MPKSTALYDLLSTISTSSKTSIFEVISTINFNLIDLILSIGVLSSISDANPTDIVQAYSDYSLYENAIAKAKTNHRVLEVLGDIEPIDKLSILEGSVIYSNNKNSVQTSIRIKGTKGKGKLDIVADKIGEQWIYKKITIRIKNPEEEIQVLQDSI